MVLFGVPFTGFAIFWIATASGMFLGGAGEAGQGGFFAFFPLFGIPFLLVGLGMLTSPYWMYRRALKTCYALTNHTIHLFATSFRGPHQPTFAVSSIFSSFITSSPFRGRSGICPDVDRGVSPMNENGTTESDHIAELSGCASTQSKIRRPFVEIEGGVP